MPAARPARMSVLLSSIARQCFRQQFRATSCLFIEPLQRQEVDGRVRLSGRAIVSRHDDIEGVMDHCTSQRVVDLPAPASRGHGEAIARLGGRHKLHDTWEQGRLVSGRVLSEEVCLALHDSADVTLGTDAVASREQQGRAAAFVHAKVCMIVVGRRREAKFRKRQRKWDVSSSANTPLKSNRIALIMGRLD